MIIGKTNTRACLNEGELLIDMLAINFIKPHWQCIDDNCSKNGDYSRGYCRRCYEINYKNRTLKGWSRFLPNEYIQENDYLKIALYDRKGKIKDWALIDIEDYEKCKDIKWTKESSGYVINAKVGRLHHYILGHNPSYINQIDHINGNGLDNRKENLRICSSTENNRNEQLSKNNTSGFKGVWLEKSTKKWCSAITVNRKKILLGRFNNKVDAARAYNAAALKYFGEFARLNIIENKDI